MSMEIIGVVMDLVVLAALGAGIYFALTLSRALNNFKNNRNELKGLISGLTANITKADNAIQKLKQDSYETADELRKLISESKMLSEELQLMNDAGNSLATRLEGLAEKTSKASQKARDDGLEQWLDQSFDDEPAPAAPAPRVKPAGYPFNIADKEFEEAGADAPEFQSEAERELFRALQGHGKKASR